MVKEGMTSVSMSDGQGADFTFLFKVNLCGSASTGKTSAMKRFTDSIFDEKYIPTIGVDFGVKIVAVSNGDLVKMQIWDTSEDPRFESVSKLYYRGAHGVIIFFDTTKRESFEELPDWINKVKSHSSPDIAIMIAGTKTDLIEERAVTLEELNDFAKANDVDYIEISSQSGNNVFRLFELMVDKMVAVRGEYQKEQSTGFSEYGEKILEGLEQKSTSVQSTRLKKEDKKKSKTCVLL